MCTQNLLKQYMCCLRNPSYTSFQIHSCSAQRKGRHSCRIYMSFIHLTQTLNVQSVAWGQMQPSGQFSLALTWMLFCITDFETLSFLLVMQKMGCHISSRDILKNGTLESNNFGPALWVADVGRTVQWCKLAASLSSVDPGQLCLQSVTFQWWSTQARTRALRVESNCKDLHCFNISWYIIMLHVIFLLFFVHCLKWMAY